MAEVYQQHRFKKRGIKSLHAQIILQVLLWFNVALVLFPFLMTVVMSFKSLDDFQAGFWSFPKVMQFVNYKYAFGVLGPNMLNSVVICIILSVGSTLLAAMCAYVFVRHDFLGKNVLFMMIIGLMMVPSVLSLTPSYLNMTNFLGTGLNLRNSWFAIILPGLAGHQVGAIFLFRTFMSQHPVDLYESAKLDGAGDFVMLIRITLPLSLAIMVIQFLNVFSAAYNDFLWPLLVIDDESKQTLMPMLKALVAEAKEQTMHDGSSYAIYLVSGIPLIFTSAFGLKYFIGGEFASGLKL